MRSKMNIPEAERLRFEDILQGQAQRFGLNTEDYLRKIWYHEMASRFGEYMALVLLDQLLSITPIELDNRGMIERSEEDSTAF